MEQVRAEQCAYRVADMRRSLGITQADVAARMGVTQGGVSAIEHASPGATELRTLASYVEALGGRVVDHRRLRRLAPRLHPTRHPGSLTPGNPRHQTAPTPARLRGPIRTMSWSASRQGYHKLRARV